MHSKRTFQHPGFPSVFPHWMLKMNFIRDHFKTFSLIHLQLYKIILQIKNRRKQVLLLLDISARHKSSIIMTGMYQIEPFSRW